MVIDRRAWGAIWDGQGRGGTGHGESTPEAAASTRWGSGTNLRELRRAAEKADRRGRRVGASLADYERIAVLGPDRVGQTLAARSTLRMERLAETTDAYRGPILSALGPIMPLDRMLFRFGANPNKHPAAYGPAWPDYLAWGIDSAVATARLMLCGQIVGAAAVARNQLERWTGHRARAADVRQREGESTVDYFARAWSVEDRFHESWFDGADDIPVDDDLVVPSSACVDHSHIRTQAGGEICPAELYKTLSEVMHGRYLDNALNWDSDGLLHGDDGWPEHVSIAVEAITDTLVLCLREIRLALAAVAEKLGNDEMLAKLKAIPEGFTAVDGRPLRSSFAAGSAPLVVPPPCSLMPLTPQQGLLPHFRSYLEEIAKDYEAVMRGSRPAGRLYTDDEATRLAFVWHRTRSARSAQAALDSERRSLGDEYDPWNVDARAAKWAMLSEVASLVALWHQPAPAASALSLIGSALRSTYWLWLEDDDRAMSILRCVLEQAARLRAWRLKPTKAEALESRDRSIPRNWLEAAGWRRLSALNRALGEFAHAHPDAKWPGAHELLAKMQMDVDPDKAIFTAGCEPRFRCEPGGTRTRRGDGGPATDDRPGARRVARSRRPRAIGRHQTDRSTVQSHLAAPNNTTQRGRIHVCERLTCIRGVLQRNCVPLSGGKWIDTVFRSRGVRWCHLAGCFDDCVEVDHSVASRKLSYPVIRWNVLPNCDRILRQASPSQPTRKP